MAVMCKSYFSVSDPKGTIAHIEFNATIYYEAKRNRVYAQLPEAIVNRLSNCGIKTEERKGKFGFLYANDVTALKKEIYDTVEKIYARTLVSETTIIRYQLFCTNEPFDGKEFGKGANLDYVHSYYFINNPASICLYASLRHHRIFQDAAGVSITEDVAFSREEAEKETDDVLRELIFRGFRYKSSESSPVYMIPYSFQAGVFFLNLWRTLDKVTKQISSFCKSNEELNAAILENKFKEIAI